jgi:hypothetical protein
LHVFHAFHAFKNQSSFVLAIIVFRGRLCLISLLQYKYSQSINQRLSTVPAIPQLPATFYIRAPKETPERQSRDAYLHI